MAISWYFVRLPGFFQEIATAFGLAMTVVVGRWPGFAGMHTSVQLLLPAPSVMEPCFAWLHDNSPTLARRGALGADSPGAAVDSVRSAERRGRRSLR